MSIEDKQLSLFDTQNMNISYEKKENEDDLLPYEIGDKIRVQISITEDEDPESFYYLKDLIGKQGIIIEVIKKPVLQYKITFKEKVVYLYHHEVSI